MSDAAGHAIFTIGHSNRPLEVFMALVQAEQVDVVLDVRRLPGSRACPQYDAETLQTALLQHGMAYEHMPALGGRRGRSLPADDRRNAMWRHAGFRHYADYALGEAFGRALHEVECRAREQRCVLMCAESVWCRCHRRIIADHLLARGHAVFHIMGCRRCVPARLTPGAQVAGGVVTYPAET